MSNTENVVDDRVACAVCGESVPRVHTVVRSGVGQLCWFCYSDEQEDDDYYDDDYDDGVTWE